MLKLTREDFISEVPQGGVRVWWYSRPGSKYRGEAGAKSQGAFCVGWADLVLLRPAVEWPVDLVVSRLPEWRKTSMRIVWLPELLRYVSHPGTVVPDLDGPYGHDTRTAKALGSSGVRGTFLDVHGARVSLGPGVYERIMEANVGRTISFRAWPKTSWSPGPVLLGHARGQLVVVAACEFAVPQVRR